MKGDLARLDVYYSALPAEVKDRGVMSFAHSPPRNRGFLVSDLWDRLSPNRPDGPPPPANARPADPMPAAKQRALIEKVGRIVDAAPEEGGDLTVEDADMVVVRRWSPVFKGKWRLIPPEAVPKPGER